MAKTKIDVNYINNLSPFQVAQDEKVASKFIELHSSLYGSKGEDPEEYYEQQKFFFQRILMESEKLQQCTPFSLYCCFIDIVLLNSSFDPAAKLVYVMQRGYNSGRKDQQGKDIWEQRAYNKLSPYGELAQRIQANQLKYADNVIVVFEGDLWKIRMNEQGQKIILWEAEIPRKSKQIIGSFIKLTRYDGSHDFYYMLDEEIERLKKASIKQNTRGNKTGEANELYTKDGQIDMGFLAAKTLKHSFKMLPKLKVSGTNTETEEDDITNLVDPPAQPAQEQQQPQNTLPPGFETVSQNKDIAPDQLSDLLVPSNSDDLDF
jgi:recombinational DNA repair protein RecT